MRLGIANDRSRPIAVISDYGQNGPMSTAAAQAAHFFDEVINHGFVWTIRDDGGFPPPANSSGERAMPFWSLESRAQKTIGSIDAYGNFTPHRLTLREFTNRWLPGLAKDGILVGVNWSGDRATGYDMKPEAVRARIGSVTG